MFPNSMFAGGDPVFDAHRNMMSSMMGGGGGAPVHAAGMPGFPGMQPFPGMMDPFGMQRPRTSQAAGHNPLAMSPFGGGAGMFGPGAMMPGMPDMMPGMQEMMRGMHMGMQQQHQQLGHMDRSGNGGNRGAGNGQSFSFSSVTSFSNLNNGEPQIFEATSSTRTAPGGVLETRRTMRDTSKGVSKMAVGHHINDKGHVIEREMNERTNERDERQEFINMDEEEAEHFNHQWRQRTRDFATDSPAALQDSRRHHNSHQRPLAVTDGLNQHNSRNARTHHNNPHHRPRTSDPRAHVDQANSRPHPHSHISSHPHRTNTGGQRPRHYAAQSNRTGGDSIKE